MRVFILLIISRRYYLEVIYYTYGEEGTKTKKNYK